MALPQIVTMVLATADDDGISLSQTPGAAGNLTITGAFASGGVATLPVARRVLITTASNESSKTITIYGTSDGYQAISESMAGPNATTGYTSRDFKTITRIAVSAAFIGAVKAGTNGIGSSPWQMINRNAQPVNVGIGCVVSGTVNYTIQWTYDNPMGAYVGGNWVDSGVLTAMDDGILIGAAATGETSRSDPVQAWRLLINSGTGTVVATGIQAGIVG